MFNIVINRFTALILVSLLLFCNLLIKIKNNKQGCVQRMVRFFMSKNAALQRFTLDLKSICCTMIVCLGKILLNIYSQ